MWILINIVRLLLEIFDIQNFPISQSRFLCRMISRENCFNFFKIWWRCRVCILFECVLRVAEFVYEFQRYLRLKLIQPHFQIVIFREHERFYVLILSNMKMTRATCVCCSLAFVFRHDRCSGEPYNFTRAKIVWLKKTNNLIQEKSFPAQKSSF